MKVTFHVIEKKLDQPCAVTEQTLLYLPSPLWERQGGAPTKADLFYSPTKRQSQINQRLFNDPFQRRYHLLQHYHRQLKSRH